MAKVDIAVVLALLAAFASAIGNVVRQRSAEEITDREVGHLELFRLSLRDTRWWLGAGGAIANYALQAVALALGSVMLVTALQVTALLFALPIYAYLTKVRVTRREWAWAVLLAAALAVVVTVGDPDSGTSRGSLGTWIAVALVVGPLLAFCVLGARLWTGSVAAVLLAVVAGCSLALFAVLTKAVVEVVHGGVGALLLAPEFYFWLAAAAAGMIFQQSSYRAGSLTASLPTSVVAKPLVGSALGALVLGETFNATGPGIFVVAAGVVLVIVATFALARGEAENVTEEAIESGRIPVITDPRVIPKAGWAQGKREPATVSGSAVPGSPRLDAVIPARPPR
jgi:drug/metabolite transporter (DMT)-like permease